MRTPHLHILLGALAVSIAAPAGATDWYAVGDAPGGLGLMYIDKDSVHVLDGGVARGTIYLIFHPAARAGAVAAHEYDMEVDCSAPRGRMFRQRYYDADDHLTREHDGWAIGTRCPGQRRIGCARSFAPAAPTSPPPRRAAPPIRSRMRIVRSPRRAEPRNEIAQATGCGP